MTLASAPRDDAGLERALGVRALAATAFNVTIGGGIFVLPAVVAASIGPSAPIAYVVCALAMGLIVLCFAQAGSRVSLTGGPYAYVEIALGPLVGFLAGTLLWLVGSLATAAVASAFAGSVAVFWAPLGTPVARVLVLLALFVLLGALNIRGTKQSARAIEVVTIAKLAPLILFVIIGAALARGPAPDLSAGLSGATLGRSVIVLIFAFAGIESAMVPSGEVRDPARTVPRALFIAMAAVTVLYVAIQYVAQAILGPALAAETRAPLAAAARAVAGAPGATIMLLGASISMLGHVSGMTLATPRALYAFGRDGILPAAFGRVHPLFHTPALAIAVQCVIAFLLAATSGFATLAIIANVGVLSLYLLCCIAAWELRRRNVHTGGTPFAIPGGAIVPWLAVAVIVWILSNATLKELGVVGGVLVAAALVFVVRRPAGMLTR
ncbi:MAG TPA: amino acid permease [Candidatus Elarobacter sp.]|nr:amino acid permease [Candidatus Elarobacter sp.]